MTRRGAIFRSVCVCSLLLAGCQSTLDQNNYGPAPVLDSAAVDTSVQNQIKVLGSLVASSSAFELPSATTSPDWYRVMEAGFNYVDEECDEYIKDLFIRSRERDRLKGVAQLADKATGAILFASNASKEAMAIVAQSFGFAEGATDLIANSYLYQIDPAHLQNLVMLMRKAYRKGAHDKKDRYATPTAAYHGVQKYLELCLPQTIEAKIDDVLSRSQATADTTGTAPDVILSSAPPPKLTDTSTGSAPPAQPAHKSAPSPGPDPAICTQIAKDRLEIGKPGTSPAQISSLLDEITRLAAKTGGKCPPPSG